MLRKAYAAASPCHSITAEASFGGSRRELLTSLRIGRVAREVWTLKTAANLAAVTGYSDRACEAWISPTQPVAIPGDAIASLLRCEFGQRFLAAIMEDAKPGWWLIFQSAFALFASARRHQTAEAELKAAIHADDDLRAAIARSEAAALLSLPNAISAPADAGRPRRRVSDRAVAARTVGAIQ